MELGNGSFNNFFDKTTNDKYFAEDFSVDENDENSHVTLLLREVPENSVVLDIGCAQGKFGGYLKDIKDCTIYGVDIVKASVEYVRSTDKYKDVFLLDIENEPTDSEEYIRFNNTIPNVDCIILSNVLEHFSDPTKVIRKLSKKLKYGGKIVVSVPNIGHADIYLNLMNGVFNYTDSGILDNTHMKFFTKASFAQWIKDINNYFQDYKFDCRYIGGTFYYNRFLNDLKEENQNLFNVIQVNQDFNVLQILFVLTKVPPQSPTLSLDKILKEKAPNIVKVLDSALSKNTIIQDLKINQNERGWYDKKIKDLEEANKWASTRIKDLEESNEWATTHMKDLEESNEWATTRIKDLAESNEWATARIKDLAESNEWATTRMKDLEAANEWATTCMKDLAAANEWATTRIKDLEAANEWASTRMKDLEAANEWASTHIKDLEEANEWGNTCNKNLEEANEWASNRIKDLEEINNSDADNIKNLEEKIHDQNTELYSLKQTLSWRITKPLRKLKAKVKHGFGK